MAASIFSGLEYLATAVMVLDENGVVRHANQAAENLLGVAAKSLIGQAFVPLFEADAMLDKALAEALVTHWDYSAQNVSYLQPGREVQDREHHHAHADEQQRGHGQLVREDAADRPDRGELHVTSARSPE